MTILKGIVYLKEVDPSRVSLDDWGNTLERRPSLPSLFLLWFEMLPLVPANDRPTSPLAESQGLLNLWL